MENLAITKKLKKGTWKPFTNHYPRTVLLRKMLHCTFEICSCYFANVACLVLLEGNLSSVSDMLCSGHVNN